MSILYIAFRYNNTSIFCIMNKIMNEIVEIKRKEFEVIEQIGERTFKVQRKGQFFFMKKFGNDNKGFEAFVDAEHRLRVSGVCNPKCYMFDKKLRIAIFEYIEGETCLNDLLKSDLPEPLIEQLFKTFWYAKNDRLALDYSPINFKYSNGKLYYLPFVVGKYVSNESFVQRDIRLWFYTKEFIQYCHSLGLSTDQSRLKSDYETNKNIALMTVKYYR